jgi:transposase-like protein
MPVNAFKWKQFVGEIILQTVRLYLKYALSYRNLKEMMTERRIKVDHTTIMRWVHRSFYYFFPELVSPECTEVRPGHRTHPYTQHNPYQGKATS